MKRINNKDKESMKLIVKKQNPFKINKNSYNKDNKELINSLVFNLMIFMMLKI